MRKLLPLLSVSLTIFFTGDSVSAAPTDKPGTDTSAAAPEAAQEKRAQLVKERREKLQKLVAEGVACRKKQDHRRVVRIASEILELSPSNFVWLSYRAYAYRCLEKRSLAIADYSACLLLRPSAELYFGRAFVYRAMEDPVAALKDIREAIKLKPMTRYYSREAKYLMELGEDEAALSAVKRGLMIVAEEPERGRNYYEIECYETMGMVYLQKKDAKNALQAFSKALDLTQGWREASRTNDKASLIQLAKDYGFRLLWRGEAYEKTGKLKEAIADYELAVQANPKNFAYRRSLLRTYRKAGQNEKALSLVTELLQEDDSPDLYYKRADLYKKLGKESLAKKDLARARKSEHGLMGNINEK